MAEGFLLGRGAANFLAEQMANQTGKQLPVITDPGRLSGGIMPFEITSGWSKATDENAYSCKAAMVYWYEGEYIKDESENAFEYTLYSPIDGNNQPSQASGDRVYAVFRGRWEMVGGVGGGINIDVSTLTSTLINNSKATMTNDKIIFAPALPTTRAIATGTTVCYVDNGSQNILLYATQFSELYPLVAPSLSAISEENGMGIYATMPSSAGVNNNLTAKINNFDAYILTGIRLGAGGGTYQWAFQPRYACILLIVGKASNDSTLTSVVQIKECHAPASTTWTTSEQSGTGLPEKMTLNGITEIPSIMKSFYQFQYQYYTNGYTPSDSATSGWTTLNRGGNWYASVPIQEAGRTRNLWVRYVCQFMDLTAYSKPTNLGLFTR